MSRKLLILIAILFSSIYAFGQQNKWPNLNYAYAKAYMYNLESNLTSNYAIIQNGKINSTATSIGRKLTDEQTAKVISLINSDIKGLNEGLSKTFIPHHAIVFFDKNDIPQSAIMFSFDGEAIKLQPEKEENKLAKELTEKEINDQLKKLSEFRKIIEDIGYTVLNSPFEYQKLKTIQTRSLPSPKFKLLGQNSVKQLVSNDDKRFDLSGIVCSQNGIFVIADKEWNKYIYQVDTSQNGFNISAVQQLCAEVDLDLEGIEFCNNKFYLIDELQNEVSIVEQGKCEMVKLDIPWQANGVDRSDWGNKGFEGIAIDCKNQILYLAKEREERNIFRIDLRSMEISEPFVKQLQNTGGHDISDLKYENGNIFIGTGTWTGDTN